LRPVFSGIFRFYWEPDIASGDRKKELEMEKLLERWARMGRRMALTGVFLLLPPLMVCSLCSADSAEVLPKGVSSIFIEGKFYSTVTERFGPDGDEEKIAEDFNSTLNSSVFPALSQLETLFAPLGVTPGSANIGKSVVSYEYDFTIIELNYAYGITDKLSLGIKIPYWEVRNNVNASLDTTDATFGKNQLFGAPVPLGAVPLAPVTLPFVQKLSTHDAQDLIGKGLDVNGDGTVDIPGYGFDPIESWSRSGISDIEAGVRYQYYKSENWRLAVTGGMRFPTGREDDPDSLVDYAFGTGAWAALVRVHQDYVGTKNLLLSATLKYDLYFPDHKEVRVPDNVDQPLTLNKENVDRDIGDIFEFELSATYEFVEGLSFSLIYRFGYKWADNISGSMGFAYNTLEAESNYKEQVYIIGLYYSTIPMYRAKKFPVPLTAYVGYRNRFDGENLLKSDYWSLGLTFFF
jgi:hypothetical protein